MAGEGKKLGIERANPLFKVNVVLELKGWRPGRGFK
jgi:hypothetical protein